MNEMEEAANALRAAADELREMKAEILRHFDGIGEEWLASCLETIADSL